MRNLFSCGTTEQRHLRALNLSYLVSPALFIALAIFYVNFQRYHQGNLKLETMQNVFTGNTIQSFISWRE